MKVLGQEGFVSGQERTIFASRTDYFCVKNGLFSGQERTTSGSRTDYFRVKNDSSLDQGRTFWGSRTDQFPLRPERFLGMYKILVFVNLVVFTASGSL